jgi:hypothetical protein
VRKDNFVAVRAEQWDLAGEASKVLTFGGLREVAPAAHRWTAMRLEARNVQTGHRTVIAYDEFRADTGVAEDVFTVRTLERGWSP